MNKISRLPLPHEVFDDRAGLGHLAAIVDDDRPFAQHPLQFGQGKARGDVAPMQHDVVG